MVPALNDHANTLCTDRSDEVSIGFIETMLDWSTSAFPGFFTKLWPGLYHVTTLQGWEAIQTSGEIKPSSKALRGNRPQQLCYAEQRGAVALFDFETFPKEKLFQIAHSFRSTFHWLNPNGRILTVWLHLDRSKLKTKAEALDPALHPLRVPTFLPYFEAHHIGPVPIAAITQVSHVVHNGRHYRVEATCSYPTIRKPEVSP